MPLFATRKPRRFTHAMVYQDQNMTGESQEKNITTNKLRGTFGQNSRHLRKYRNKKKGLSNPMRIGIIILLIISAIIILNIPL